MMEDENNKCREQGESDSHGIITPSQRYTHTGLEVKEAAVAMTEGSSEGDLGGEYNQGAPLLA